VLGSSRHTVFTFLNQSGIFVVTSTLFFTAPPYCLPVRVAGTNEAFDHQQYRTSAYYDDITRGTATLPHTALDRTAMPRTA
jgi:hypothetical protein